MIISRKETEDVLLLTYRNCEKLFTLTQMKPNERLEVKFTQPNETISFKPPISIEGSWITGLTSLEVYNCIFIITDAKNKFELY